MAKKPFTPFRKGLGDQSLVVTAPGSQAGDFVKKGKLKGFAQADAAGGTEGNSVHPNKVVIEAHGIFENVKLVAGAAAIAEGDPLVWDDAAKAMTNTGATSAEYDAVAYMNMDVAAGATKDDGIVLVGQTN